MLNNLKTVSPKSAALTGFLLVLPLAFVGAIAGLEIEPLNTFAKNMLTYDGHQTNPLGFFVMIVGMLLMPTALAVVVWPMIRKGADGKRKLYPANLILGAVIFVFIAMFVGGVIADQYPCWVGVPNCD